MISVIFKAFPISLVYKNTADICEFFSPLRTHYGLFGILRASKAHI